MINENIIFLNDIKTYSTELLEYVKYNFISDEIIKEIIIYLESSLSEIDNINNYILELESKINELEQRIFNNSWFRRTCGKYCHKLS